MPIGPFKQETHNFMEVLRGQPIGRLPWRTFFPHLLVLAWLIYLGISIWGHVLNSVQPPLYDPLSYFLKAKNFWQSVASMKSFNPLNVEPSVRPPGSILMSYPFGFSPDFKGFLFRSIFVPILCVVAAVYIAAGVSYVKKFGWWVAALALLFSSLPMFYHFDLNDEVTSPVYWGLVDNFHAGISAVSVASLVRYHHKRSVFWLWVGSIAASFTLLIKPSGLMIMALFALLWITIEISSTRFPTTENKSGKLLLKLFVVRGIPVYTTYVLIITTSFTSHYLSSSNIDFGKQALVVMREVLQIPLVKYLELFRQSTGQVAPLLIFIVILYIIYIFNKYQNNQEEKIKQLVLFVFGLVIWGSGAWYWLIVQAGGSQIRYFYPFILMGLVCFIPATFFFLSQANRLVRVLFLVFCFLPGLNIGVILAAGTHPSISWQKSVGVSVSVGSDREVVSQAYEFLHELRETGNSAQVYSFCNGTPSMIFENIGTYERIIHPDKPFFHSVLAIDWLRGFAVRTEEILDSDYILIRKYDENEVHELLGNKIVDTFHDETSVFEAWLSTRDNAPGVEVYSEGSHLLLLRVIDRPALARAINLFVSEREWRQEFTDANKPVFWWNQNSVLAYNNKLSAMNTSFQGVYMLHDLSIRKSDSGLKVEVWWEPFGQEAVSEGWNLFLHLVDSTGSILNSQQITLSPYRPPFEDRRWRHGEVVFPLKYLNRGATSLAFGIYRLPDKFLFADKGKTDWNGKRVIVPINFDAVAN